MYIHGGFDPAQPNIPTGDLFKIDLENALGGVAGLNNQLTTHKGQDGGNSMQTESDTHDSSNTNSKKEMYQISERIFMATNNQNPYVQEATFHKLEYESKKLNTGTPSVPLQQGSIQYLET